MEDVFAMVICKKKMPAAAGFVVCNQISPNILLHDCTQRGSSLVCESFFYIFLIILQNYTIV
jgi:hypothetical protein